MNGKYHNISYMYDNLIPSSISKTELKINVKKAELLKFEQIQTQKVKRNLISIQQNQALKVRTSAI